MEEDEEVYYQVADYIEELIQDIQLKISSQALMWPDVINLMHTLERVIQEELGD